MAKKQRARPAMAPAPEPPVPQRRVVVNVLLDWRFNLAILVCMEILLIAIFWQRESTRYVRDTARNALWTAETREDYEKAYRKYWWLHRNDPAEPSYIQGLGDAALGLERYSEAEKRYKEATSGRYDRPRIKLSLALSYRGRAGKTSDPEARKQYLTYSYRLLDLAYNENPRDIEVNYWKAMFAKTANDYIEAAEYFSRVRRTLLLIDRKPTPYEKRLIADAREQLESIKALVLDKEDYSLDVKDVVFRPRPKVEALDTRGSEEPTTPPAAVEPKAATTPTL